MANKKAPTKRLNKKRIIVTILAVLSFAGVLVFTDVYITGYSKYFYTKYKCGTEPVVVNDTVLWGGSHTYLRPGEYVVGRAQQAYMCTEQQAIDAGYRSSPLHQH